MTMSRSQGGVVFATRSARSRFSDIVTYITYISISLFILLYFFNIESFTLYYFILTIIFTNIILDNRTDSLTLSLNVCLIYLFIVPNYTLMLGGDSNYILLLVFSYMIFEFLGKFSRINTYAVYDLKLNYGSYSRNVFLCFSLLLLSIILPFLISGGYIFGIIKYDLPLGISLIYFERVCHRCSSLKIYILLSMYAISILSVIIFHWGGYGRIIIGAYIMMPVLLAAYRGGLPVRSWHAALLAPPALLVALISRSGEGDFTSLHQGSSAHHLILTKQVFDVGLVLRARWEDYFDQWVLFFLNWFPRNVWPDKPVGIGFYFVDEWSGRAGLGASHSVSLGYMGEAFYLLGPWWPLGIGVGMATVILSRRFLSLVTKPYVAPVIVYDITLISYVWGGFAMFGSRAWFTIIPMVFWVFLLKRRSQRLTKFA